MKTQGGSEKRRREVYRSKGGSHSALILRLSIWTIDPSVDHGGRLGLKMGLVVLCSALVSDMMSASLQLDVVKKREETIHVNSMYNEAKRWDIVHVDVYFTCLFIRALVEIHVGLYECRLPMVTGRV